MFGHMILTRLTWYNIENKQDQIRDDHIGDAKVPVHHGPDQRNVNVRQNLLHINIQSLHLSMKKPGQWQEVGANPQEIKPRLARPGS